MQRAGGAEKVCTHQFLLEVLLVNGELEALHLLDVFVDVVHDLVEAGYDLH